MTLLNPTSTGTEYALTRDLYTNKLTPPAAAPRAAPEGGRIDRSTDSAIRTAIRVLERWQLHPPIARETDCV